MRAAGFHDLILHLITVSFLALVFTLFYFFFALFIFISISIYLYSLDYLLENNARNESLCAEWVGQLEHFKFRVGSPTICLWCSPIHSRKRQHSHYSSFPIYIFQPGHLHLYCSGPRVQDLFSHHE